MARYEDALAALNPFRLELQTRTFRDLERLPMIAARAGPPRLSAFSIGGASPAFATPLTNVHATGVGVRGGKVIRDEFVIKVYVFVKLDLGEETPDLMKSFGDIEVDVEPLPVQLASARTPRRLPRRRSRAEADSAPEIENRRRFRPIPGGVSVSPLNARYVGTLGCFVKGVSAGAEQIFALSNNHVLANVNDLPIGTLIVQPGPETGLTSHESPHFRGTRKSLNLGFLGQL